MPRRPRKLAQLRAGFAAEAETAARYRAYARRAEADKLPNLARHWRRLALAKDELAVVQLEAFSPAEGAAQDLDAAIAETLRENEVFYPEMISGLDPAHKPLIEKIIESQRQHLAWMQALRGALAAARGDVEAPVDEERR